MRGRTEESGGVRREGGRKGGREKGKEGGRNSIKGKEPIFNSICKCMKFFFSCFFFFRVVVFNACLIRVTKQILSLSFVSWCFIFMYLYLCTFSVLSFIKSFVSKVDL